MEGITFLKLGVRRTPAAANTHIILKLISRNMMGGYGPVSTAATTQTDVYILVRKPPVVSIRMYKDIGGSRARIAQSVWRIYCGLVGRGFWWDSLPGTAGDFSM
jgi:hypothetical protein